MANFETAVNKSIAHEGGYVWNKKYDSGGETKFGITDKLDGDIDRKADIDGDGKGDVYIRDLTREQAKIIYKREFWDVMKGDQFKDQQVANIVFDAFINSGPLALKQFQAVLGTPVDGDIGPKTLAVLSIADPKLVYNKFKESRIRFYKGIVERKPDQKVFINGWLNRINAFRYVGILLLLVMMTSCGANYHLRRVKHHMDKAIEKGADIKRDTIVIHDTVLVADYHNDTLVHQINWRDTIRIETVRTKLKLKYDTVLKTLYVDQYVKPDTIIRKVEVPCVTVSSTSYPWWWLLITAGVGMLVGILWFGRSRA